MDEIITRHYSVFYRIRYLGFKDRDVQFSNGIAVYFKTNHTPSEKHSILLATIINEHNKNENLYKITIGIVPLSALIVDSIVSID